MDKFYRIDVQFWNHTQPIGILKVPVVTALSFHKDQTIRMNGTAYRILDIDVWMEDLPYSDECDVNKVVIKVAENYS